jgi:hypothetical protein
MNWRNSLIALAVLAVLIVVLLIVFREPPPEEMKARFPEIKKDSVTKIWLRNPVPLTEEEKAEGKAVTFEEATLERVGEGEEATWKLTSPVEYPAYKSYVDSLLTRLEEIKLVDVAVESKANWAPLEVDPEQAVQVKIWAGKAELADFFVGAYKTGNTMLRLVDDERVFKVQGSIRYVFGKRTRDWRDKTVLDYESDHVTRITYRTTDGELTFEKQDKDWAEAPTTAGSIENFDPKKVRSFVSSIAKLRTADFADDVKPEDVGLSPPRGEILVTLSIPAEEPEVKDAGDVKAEQDAGEDPMEPTYTIENVRILVGDDKDDSQTYLMVEGNPQIFLITSHLKERLLPTADKFATAPRPEGEAPAMPPPPPPTGTQDTSSIPPEVMKQVQDEIRKQQMMKKIMEKQKSP